MATRLFTGGSIRTRTSAVVYRCPCGERYRAEIHAAVESTDAAAARLLDGTLLHTSCPACGRTNDVAAPLLYHDVATPRLVLVLPDALRHRELEERARLMAELAADREPAPDYVLFPSVVFGAAGLRALVQPNAPAVAPPPSAAPAPVAAPREPAAALEALRDTPREEPRPRVSVPDPRQAMTERWIAAREGPTAFIVDDSVVVCAALAPAALEHFIKGPIELRTQLHRLPSYPVLALTLVADLAGGRSDEHVLCVPLDLARPAHKVVLDALARKTRLQLELFDAEYLPVIEHRIEAPLEENVRRLLSEAKDATERLAPTQRGYERARAQLLGPGYDRLGRTDVELPDESELLDRPAAVRAALSAVARWSEPSAEAYIVEVRSLPLGQWRAARARVVRRALDAGIAVSRPLVERTAREHAAPLPSWPELLAIQVQRFSEVAARQRPNDLSATEEADNWELLLRECSMAGVAVDDAVRALAQVSVKRARAQSSGAGVDMRTLGTTELVALLDQIELRREAALILCERREPQTLTPLFATIRRMTRGEANVVLPAVTAFGPAVEKFLIDGLRSKKSFVRQGSALALGSLKTPLGVDALVRALTHEPTEIWGEMARALGDVGTPAVMPLAATLRDVEPERRDRIVRALAHVAAAAGGVRGPIEMLAAGRDAQVAGAAKKALALVDEVRQADVDVRSPDKPVEGTVVRGFSRRFYEALGGSIEISADDLEEIYTAEHMSPPEDEDAEPLDEEDLLAPADPLRLHDETTGPRTRPSLPRDR